MKKIINLKKNLAKGNKIAIKKMRINFDRKKHGGLNCKKKNLNNDQDNPIERKGKKI